MVNKGLFEKIYKEKNAVWSWKEPQKEIKKTNKIDITLFSMAKNTEITEHTSTKEGFVYIIEGKEIEMKPGTFIFIEENKVHSLKTEGNTSFLLTLHK